MELINKHVIQNLIPERIRSSIELEYYKELDSTNSHLLAKAPSEKINVCIAESQTAGRGRHGKNWYSPAGSNIYLSMSMSIDKTLPELSGLSLVVGVTLAELLQRYCKKVIGVKWPNDLLINGKKLSGILLELKHQGDGMCKVIIGIGINVVMPIKAEKYISQECTSLDQYVPTMTVNRNKIIANLVTQLIENLMVFQKNGFENFHNKWNKLDIWYQRPVEIHLGNRRIKGIHSGVDSSGALLLEQEGEISRWTSGEVSLRSIK